MPPKKEMKPAKNTDLTNKAYEAISEMLFYNEILPGQKIKYNDLANRIGVSMTPVIQAVKWLEFRNIVRHEANRGYYINEVSIKEVEEVYNTRLLLEVSLVPDIIKNIDERGIQKLKAAYEEYKIAVAEDKHHKRIMKDMVFHMTLASLADCKIQLKMIHELFDVLLLRYSRNLFILSVMDTSLKEHQEILEHLEKKDEKGLNNALAYHITKVKDHIVNGMSKLIVEDRESFKTPYIF